MRNKKHVLLVVHGATGDLFSRYIFEALFYLYKAYSDQIIVDILCTGSRDYDKKAFHNFLMEKEMDGKQAKNKPWFDNIFWPKLSPHIHYARLPHTGAFRFNACGDWIKQYFTKFPDAPMCVYLSIPPESYLSTCKLYKEADILDDKSRQISFLIEKPIAESVEAAKDLAEFFKENPHVKAVCSDHYNERNWGLSGVFTRRFGNELSEPCSNHLHAARYLIYAYETIGAAPDGTVRDGYTGAVLDMLTHLMPLYAALTIEQPSEMTPRTVFPMMVNQVKYLARHPEVMQLQRAQYKAGRMLVKDSWQDVPGFIDEGGNPEIETAAKLVIYPPGSRWNREVLFALVTGKRFRNKESAYREQHKVPSHKAFDLGQYAMFGELNKLSPNERSVVFDRRRWVKEGSTWYYKHYVAQSRTTMMPDPYEQYRMKARPVEDEIEIKNGKSPYSTVLENALIPPSVKSARISHRRGVENTQGDVPVEIGGGLTSLPFEFSYYSLSALCAALEMAKDEPMIYHQAGEKPKWTIGV